MEQNLVDFTSRIIKEYTYVTIFLSISLVISIFVSGLYVNYLRGKIKKLTSDNSEDV